MVTWSNISIDSLKAAQELHRAGRARSAASRAYFAAYAAVTARLRPGMEFADGQPNPPHAKIHQLLKNNVELALGHAKRKDAVHIIRKLREQRMAADYDRQATLDDATSMMCVREAARLLDLLEVR